MGNCRKRPFQSTRRVRSVVDRRALAVLLLASACSLTDLSYLQQSGSGGDAGSAGSSDSPVQGGASTAGGSPSSSAGGSTETGGSPSNSAGGSTATGGTNSIGGAGTASGGISANPPVAYGPWDFDTAADVPSNFTRARAGIKVSWVAEGVSVPLGSMVIDTLVAGSGEARHAIEVTDLSQSTLHARVRMSTGTGTAVLYAASANYTIGMGPNVPIDTTWVTLDFAIAEGTSQGGVYQKDQTIYLAVQLQSAGVLWVDRVWLTPPVTSGTGGTNTLGT